MAKIRRQRRRYGTDNWKPAIQLGVIGIGVAALAGFLVYLSTVIWPSIILP